MPARHKHERQEPAVTMRAILHSSISSRLGNNRNAILGLQARRVLRTSANGLASPHVCDGRYRGRWPDSG